MRLGNKYVYAADFSQILPGSGQDVRKLKDNNISRSLVSFEIKSKEQLDLLFSCREDFNLITYHFFFLSQPIPLFYNNNKRLDELSCISSLFRFDQGDAVFSQPNHKGPCYVW